MGRLEGRIAIVTGAASGLRLATSKRFAAEGGGQGLDPIGADITRSADLAALRDHIADVYGRAV